MVDADHIVKFSNELLNNLFMLTESSFAILSHGDPFNDGISEMNSTWRNLILVDGNRCTRHSLAKCFSKFTLDSAQSNLKGS